MKILFAIKSVSNPGGGAERVLASVASGLASRGHDVAIVTSDPATASSYYALSPSVRLLMTGIGGISGQSGPMETLRRMRAYRGAVLGESPDVVVGFMHSTYIPLGLALLGTNRPLVASEHIGPEHYRQLPIQWLLLQLTPVLCKRITVVSDQIRTSFNAWLRQRMVVVPNPVLAGTATPAGNPPEPTRKVILSVGRLAAQKDHRTLIAAFARIAASDRSVVLRILGEGELRHDLEAQIEALGLAGRVELPGAVADVGPEYQATTLFVLPSRYESFGLATAEALLHALPAIGFADCPGTNELIVDGINGRLVFGSDRVAALADMLEELMSDTDQRLRLAGASTQSIIDRFGIDRILDEWEDLLAQTVKPCTA